MKKLLVTKHQVELYRFRGNPKASDEYKPWANIYLDTNGGTRLTIVSDYGTWTHQWTSKPFPKAFIVEFSKNDEYIMEKLAKQDFWDREKVKAGVINELKDARVTGTITRAEFDLAIASDLYAFNECESEADLWSYIPFHAPTINKFYKEDLQRLPSGWDYHLLLKRFLKEVWPYFIKQLQDELKEGVA